MAAIAVSDWLTASNLPARWSTRERFVVLDTRLGDARRVLACWAAWRTSANAAVLAPAVLHPARPHCQLHIVTIAAHLPTVEEMTRLRASVPDGHALRSANDPAGDPARDAPAERAETAETADLFRQLLAVWPPAVAGLHRLTLDGGAVQLLLAVGGDARQWLPQLRIRVDAFWVDADSLAGDCDPSWALRLFKAAGRLASPRATLVMPAADAAARAALRTAGFVLQQPTQDAGSENDGAVVSGPWTAVYAPTFAPRRRGTTTPVAAASSKERHALIVGAGLAGCATAWALAEHGWTSTLFDTGPAPAGGASGNPAGLFHGIVHPQDGVHARVHRAAALEARRAVQVAIDHHGVAGATAGLLRVEAAPPAAGDDDDAALATMRAIVRGNRLPPDYVRAVDANEASRLAGIRMAHPCWYYPAGGWVQPAGLARSFLERAGSRVRFCGDTAVAALRRCGSMPAETLHSDRVVDSGPARWHLLDSSGCLLGDAAVVVLANAGAAAPLADSGLSLNALGIRTQQVRGQLSTLAVADLAKELPGLVLPRIPLVGAGWLLPEIDGQVVFGATAQADDADPTVRAADQALNVAALARLIGATHLPVPQTLQGRTAWRCVTADRLPLIGPLPNNDQQRLCAFGRPGQDRCDPESTAAGVRQPDLTARWPGLYTFSGLGSRGITWAALGAQLLASWIAGSPAPLAGDLVDALDPGRFALRRRRRSPVAARR